MVKRLLAVLPLCLLLLPAPAVLASWHDIDWFDNADGYVEAVKLAGKSGDPVLVYFYTDWCPYCRQFNDKLLADEAVQAELDTMLAVRVDAEGGPDERSLAGHYRVRGYPALYVYNAQQGGGFSAIRRTVSDGAGGVRLKTAEEFVATLRAAAK